MKEMINILICGCFAVIFGLVFAILFQNLYNLIQDYSSYTWTWAMTFYGGLFGGMVGFLFIFLVFMRKEDKGAMRKVLIIAPACLTLGHGLGRIGCFLHGCCYGKATEAWYGIYFPSLGYKAIPTQLFEAAFLLLLSALLIYLAFRRDFHYTFIIYLSAYCLFRFFLEFLRDDPRGAFLSIFSPSQVFSLGLLILSVPLFFLLKNVIFKEVTHEQS